MPITQQLRLIEQIDRLVRLKSTGNASELACKLAISKLILYRLILIMQEMNALIYYDTEIHSFVYDQKDVFTRGFDPELEYIPYYSIQAGKLHPN